MGQAARSLSQKSTESHQICCCVRHKINGMAGPGMADLIQGMQVYIQRSEFANTQGWPTSTSGGFCIHAIFISLVQRLTVRSRTLDFLKMAMEN